MFTGKREVIWGLSLIAMAAALSSCSSGSSDKPTMPPAVSLTEVEAEQLISESLDLYWERAAEANPGLERPEVERIRIVSNQEHDEVLADCLTEAGFDAAASPTGGVDYVGTEQQEGPFRLAEYVCAAEYPLDPAFRAPLSKAEFAFLYDYWKNDLTACLSNEGHQPPDPPSLEQFEEQFGQQGSWVPYAAVQDDPSMTEDRFAELTEKCPEYPDGFHSAITP